MLNELQPGLGVTHVINSRTRDLASALETITGSAGIDYVVDTTGRPELLRTAADSIAVRGTIALVGAARPGTTRSSRTTGSRADQ